MAVPWGGEEVDMTKIEERIQEERERSKLLRKLHCGFDLDTSDRHALNIDSEGHAEGAAI